MHVNHFALFIGFGFLAGAMPVLGQTSAGDTQDASTQTSSAAPTAEGRWSIHFQATAIGQYHGSFRSLYEGENSLPPHPERRVSITATVFLGFRVNEHIELVFNPEVAGGKGFGMVTGIAGFTNGEIPRVSSATPTLYPARGFVRTVWGLGPETELVENGVNQIAGSVPSRRLTTITGKFAITDYFDNNTYSHDPRKQFMNWSLMYNGAWDYPADTRGYTIGTMQELTMRSWSLRTAAVMEPTTANGPTFDTRLAKNRGVAVEWEKRYKPMGHAGAMRVLGFQNRARAGTFRDAMLPDGTTDLAATRRPGTKKYGFGLNVEQEITRDIGAFARYGWSDGKTEAWAFTQIDRSVSGGISVQGRLWKRTRDNFGVAAAHNYLSGDDRCFLAAGGMGFIIGDGRLNYAPESITEAYYAWHPIREWTFTLDYQHIVNPAYNRDRGPVSVGTLRVHWER
ncbi:MAG: carbohydrate porin [Bryobacteraceae bacterium]|jgi:high affinity Mn2+ porin